METNNPELVWFACALELCFDFIYIGRHCWFHRWPFVWMCIVCIVNSSQWGRLPPFFIFGLKEIRIRYRFLSIFYLKTSPISLSLALSSFFFHSFWCLCMFRHLPKIALESQHIHNNNNGNKRKKNENSKSKSPLIKHWTFSLLSVFPCFPFSISIAPLARRMKTGQIPNRSIFHTANETVNRQKSNKNSLTHTQNQ